MKAKAEQTKKELQLKQLQQQQQIDRERDELRGRAELQKAEYEIEEARINVQQRVTTTQCYSDTMRICTSTMYIYCKVWPVYVYSECIMKVVSVQIRVHYDLNDFFAFLICYGRDLCC